VPASVIARLPTLASFAAVADPDDKNATGVVLNMGNVAMVADPIFSEFIIARIEAQ
jgi:hypothetical protein